MSSAVALLRRQLPRRIDALAAAALALLAQVETWTTSAYQPKALFAAAALGLTVPLAWRRTAPIAVMALVLAVLLAAATSGRRMDSLYIMFALIVAFAAVGSYCERGRALAGLGLGLSLLAAVLLVERDAAGDGADQAVLDDLVFIGGILTVVWALAAGLRERSLRAGELERRADRLARDRDAQARAAVAEERARIARELHDVVAHSISVIAIQTGSLRRRLRKERPRESEELATVEQTARQALSEMRRMLGLLRTDDDRLELAPQPGMEEIARLVERTRETGLAVELEVSGRRRPLPPGVDLAAYRIAQEALTNVLKHAGAARACVDVRYGERELELAVTDDGRGPAAADGGGGHGLVGMRERAALYGGTLEVGPAAERGFAVRASLPIP